MTLTQLKTYLSVITGLSVNEVYFDYSVILNNDLDKNYPLILWNIDNPVWTKDLRSGEKSVDIDVYCLSYFDESVDKITIWDTLEGYLDEYIASFDSNQYLTIKKTAIPLEYYDRGLLSIDNEAAMRYKVNLKLWC